MQVQLIRVSQSAQGTFGVLLINGLPFCVTCEEPWKNNQKGVSCIPAGRYLCKKHSGPRFKDVWQLMDVPGRSAVLIHNGNTTADTEGCILVGQNYSRFSGIPGVGGSKLALEALRGYLPDEFWIDISYANEPKK